MKKEPDKDWKKDYFEEVRKTWILEDRNQDLALINEDLKTEVWMLRKDIKNMSAEKKKLVRALVRKAGKKK